MLEECQHVSHDGGNQAVVEGDVVTLNLNGDASAFRGSGGHGWEIAGVPFGTATPWRFGSVMTACS